MRTVWIQDLPAPYFRSRGCPAIRMRYCLILQNRAVDRRVLSIVGRGCTLVSSHVRFHFFDRSPASFRIVTWWDRVRPRWVLWEARRGGSDSSTGRKAVSSGEGDRKEARWEGVSCPGRASRGTNDSRGRLRRNGRRPAARGCEVLGGSERTEAENRIAETSSSQRAHRAQRVVGAPRFF